jgi:hypothetical protein
MALGDPDGQPYGSGVPAWFEVDDSDTAAGRALDIGAGIVLTIPIRRSVIGGAQLRGRVKVWSSDAVTSPMSNTWPVSCAAAVCRRAGPSSIQSAQRSSNNLGCNTGF